MRKLNEIQIEGRLKNAVARLLDKRLIVPRVFIETRWPTSNRRVDVLAIDRAGAGDIHCVEIKKNIESAYPMFPAFKTMPAHYKYVAFFYDGNLSKLMSRIDKVALYADDGIGRIGIIVASDQGVDKSLTATVLIEPERFRVDKRFYRLIDRFMESHTADLEIRQ